MERKAKVTQDAVTDACDELMESGKNVTVNAIIAMTGDSFSTIGAMVKNWKAEQALKTAPAIEMPETVKTAMHKAVTVIWDAASSLASDEIDRIRKEAGEGIDKAKIELSEYVGEITRLEKELEQSQNITAETGKRLSTAMSAYGGHHIGTAIMGLDLKRSVVGPDCRAHGVENLFVPGSAVFPTSGQANPTLTLVALSLRLAEQLAGGLCGRAHDATAAVS
ncbi:MAG: GMC oxidoreductase [Nitrosomonas sp.]